jgi:uncharacterized protein
MMPDGVDCPPVSIANASLQPVQPSERFSSLDLLRGFALFGVLLINLLDFFRVSLWDHVLRFHSDPGALNHAIDIFAAGVVEFKAFNLFAFTFGIGMAIQAERRQLRGANAELFLVRRFLVLLVIGAIHMTLIANVDILMLYAVCGLVLILLLRLPAVLLTFAGVAAIYLPTLLPLGPSLPPQAELRHWAILAAQHYGHGSFADIAAFRWQETRSLIAPLLFETAQNTAGMMLLGIAAWRSGVIRAPGRFRMQLWIFCVIAGLAGATNTVRDVLSRATGNTFVLPHFIRVIGAEAPLALCYGALLLAMLGDPKRIPAWAARFAAAGQMALTNYLIQSLVLGFIFYGFGLGLFGRLAPAPAAAFAVAFYTAQLFFSQWWLARYRFGPCEWLWRSLTYGQRQPMRRNTKRFAMV